MALNKSEQSPPAGNNQESPKTKNVIFAVILLVGVSIAFYQVMKEVSWDNRLSRYPVRDWVSLKEGTKVDADLSGNVKDKQEIRIAIAPIVSPEKSMEMYASFVAYVGAKLGRKPTALYRPTYSETNDLVRYQRCDIAIVCTYPFIRGEREFGMKALVVPQIGGEKTYQSVIIVPKNSPAKTILDLRGKRFASADIISTTGWLFPAMLLMDAGEAPDKFFGEHVITGSHDRSLQAVVDGFVDGAAVHGIVYSQMVVGSPLMQQKIRVLIKSPPFGIPPIVAHPDLDPELRKAIVSILLNMSDDAQGKQILKDLQIERFVVPDADLFASLRLAVSKLEKWR